MRKESSTLQKCKRQMATLGFDSQLAYHRVKLILKIYRDVVWVLSERVEELHEYAWELGAQDADTGLIYLQSFAPDMDRSSVVSPWAERTATTRWPRR